jgi:hypothetical protein
VPAGRQLDDPAFLPCGRGDEREEGGLLQSVTELAEEDFGQSTRGQEEAGVFWFHPREPVVGQTAGRDEQVDVRVVEHGTGPGVEHGEQPRGGGAEVARVTGEFQDRRRGGLHDKTVDDLGVGSSERAQLFGQGEGQVVEGAVEKAPGARLFEPAPGLLAVALRAVAVFAGVVGVEFLVAVVALKHLAAERGRATVFDGRHDAVVAWQESLGELLPIVRAVAAEDVRHLEQPKVSERREKKRLRDPS